MEVMEEIALSLLWLVITSSYLVLISLLFSSLLFSSLLFSSLLFSSLLFSSSLLFCQLQRVSGNVESYPSSYNLQLTDVHYCDTIGYQVIEPASSVHLLVGHKNIGGMPTPSHQYIRAYVNNNKWVTCHVCISHY